MPDIKNLAKQFALADKALEEAYALKDRYEKEMLTKIKAFGCDSAVIAVGDGRTTVVVVDECARVAGEALIVSKD